MNWAASVYKSMSQSLSMHEEIHSLTRVREHTWHNKHTPHMMKEALSSSQAKVVTARMASRSLLNGWINIWRRNFSRLILKQRNDYHSAKSSRASNHSDWQHTANRWKHATGCRILPCEKHIRSLNMFCSGQSFGDHRKRELIVEA